MDDGDSPGNDRTLHNTFRSCIGATPFWLIYGHDSRLTFPARVDMQVLFVDAFALQLKSDHKAAKVVSATTPEHQIAYVDSKRVDVHYEVGTLVSLNSKTTKSRSQGQRSCCLNSLLEYLQGWISYT
jgi:hypothetical protein